MAVAVGSFNAEPTATLNGHAVAVGSRLNEAPDNLGGVYRLFLIFQRLLRRFFYNMGWYPCCRRPKVRGQRPEVRGQIRPPTSDLRLLVSLAGCLAAIGLAGCCAQPQCRCQKAACAEAAPADMSSQPVPAAPEYPRFHPVPTRPVFLPDGVEPTPPRGQLTPTEAPTLSTVPNDGWHPVDKGNATSPSSQSPSPVPPGEGSF